MFSWSSLVGFSNSTTDCPSEADRFQGLKDEDQFKGTIKIKLETGEELPISKLLKDLKLVDYKVRILNTGTEAVTRVSIESTDSQGKNWFTIGVSTNIIDASFKALIDSLDYKLYKEKAPANN